MVGGLCLARIYVQQPGMRYCVYLLLAFGVHGWLFGHIEAALSFMAC
jgi:hypothetical protein